MIYVTASVAGGLTLPRIEQAYLSSQTFGLSVASAQAYLSAAASGTMALTGIVFAMAFVMVQFSAIAYSPRLVMWFARDPMLFHSLGSFAATFLYALFTLAWIDREASGKVPMISSLLVATMLIVGMLLFSRLMQRLTDLQIGSVLRLIGDRGRAVIGDMYRRFDGKPEIEQAYANGVAERNALGPVTQTLIYSGGPRTIGSLDIGALVEQAQRANCVIVLSCGVGDTLVEDTLLLQIHGAPELLSEKELMRAVRLARERKFRAGPQIPDPSPGRCRYQGAVAGHQRSDDGGADNRSDRRSAASPGQVRIGYGLCKGCGGGSPSRLSDADLGGLPGAWIR